MEVWYGCGTGQNQVISKRIRVDVLHIDERMEAYTLGKCLYSTSWQNDGVVQQDRRPRPSDRKVEQLGLEGCRETIEQKESKQRGELKGGTQQQDASTRELPGAFVNCPERRERERGRGDRRGKDRA